jgi:hypothetical protein
MEKNNWKKYKVPFKLNIILSFCNSQQEDDVGKPRRQAESWV